MPKRRRKVEITELSQPVINLAEAMELSSHYGFPARVYVPSGGLLHFHGTAIITGDGLYRGYDSKGVLKHAIVTNPKAAERQAEFFARY